MLNKPSSATLILCFIKFSSAQIYDQQRVYNYLSPFQSPLTLQCVFHYDPQTSTYDCVSSNTTIIAAEDGFNSFFGSHIANHSDYDVSGFKISLQHCKFVPNNLGNLMPNLRKLEITYSGLLAIDQTDTYKMPNLQYLILRSNRIVELSALLFRNNPNLMWIDFSDNFIKFVHPAALDDLNVVKYIDFSNNICVQNGHATDNFREWERELRRNCIPADGFYGLTQPLKKIADEIELIRVGRVSGR